MLGWGGGWRADEEERVPRRRGVETDRATERGASDLGVRRGDWGATWAQRGVSRTSGPASYLALFLTHHVDQGSGRAAVSSRAGSSGQTSPSPYGRLLKQHRDANGLSQLKLADAAGVSENTISNIERGATRAHPSSGFRRLSQTLFILRRKSAR